VTGTSRSPVPDRVADELARVARRWQDLPLDDALRRLPAVRALVEELAGEPVPDLGPGVVIDQLTVVVYDACRAASALPPGEGATDTYSPRRLDGIRDRLAELRRSL
jgi:hypothetical protein